LIAAAYLITGLGHQWVIVFFVLSGYLVGGSVLRSVAVNHWSWRVYLLNRLTRLYAVLIPALVFGGLLDLGASTSSEYPVSTVVTPERMNSQLPFAAA
jgi:peptidoglycan/LPS O-acetylase OafA/YrhL